MFRNVNDKMQKHLFPLYPGNTATKYVPTSTDIGVLAVMSSNLGYAFASTGAPDIGLNLVNGVVGIVSYVDSTGTTHGSTATPFYVDPLFVGDVVEADFSTVYAGSTVLELATTNIGAYYAPCYSTGSTSVGTEALNALRTRYIDPSTRSNVPCSSAAQIFKLMSYSTVSKTGVFRVQTS